MSTSPPERRPLAVRQQAWVGVVTAWLVRQGVHPDTISLAGMFAALLAGLILGLTPWQNSWYPLGFLVAAALVQLRLLANLFDGMVALASGKRSPWGELYNEVPDRVSDAAILLGAGYALGSRHELGYLAACLALFIAYLRAEGKVAGAPQEYCGPMAKQQRMATITFACVLSALIPSDWLHDRLPIMTWALVLILAGGLVTVVRRLVRIARFLGRPAR